MYRQYGESDSDRLEAWQRSTACAGARHAAVAAAAACDAQRAIGALVLCCVG